MIQIIRKYLTWKTALAETAKQHDRDGSVWYTEYKPHHSHFSEILNDFGSLDSVLAFEDGFAEAKKNLEPYRGELTGLDIETHFREFMQIGSLIESQNCIDAVISILKTDYNIVEDEIEKPREVTILEQQLAATKKESEELQERNKILLQQLLTPQPVPEQKPIASFKETDVEEVEKLVSDLLDTVVFATTIEEGRIELKVPIEQIERLYSSIKDALENTDYIILSRRAQNILDNIDGYSKDPSGLLEITKTYVQNIRLEFSRYHRRIEQKERLRE